MEARRDLTNAEEMPAQRSLRTSTRDRWNYQNPTSNSQITGRITAPPKVIQGDEMTRVIADHSILAVVDTGTRAEPVEIWKARKLIAECSDYEISLTKIAVQIHISSNYLSEKFKHVTGENFVQYVARIRTGKATELLSHSDSPITEIAFAVGFQSLSQFNRVFKKLTKQSPTQFRASHRPTFKPVASGRNSAKDYR